MLIKTTIKRNVFPMEKEIYKQYILLIGGLVRIKILHREKLLKVKNYKTGLDHFLMYNAIVAVVWG